MTEEAFVIRHFSAREDSYKPSVKWYQVNIIIEAKDEHLHSVLKAKTEDWTQIEYCDSIEEGEKYFKGLRLNFEKETSELSKAIFSHDENMERGDVFKKGYKYNYGPYMTYIEKFDVFRYYDFIEKNGITEHALKYINALAQGKSDSRFAHWGQLNRCLETLFLWWD